MTENDLVRELMCGQDHTYLLADNSLFLQTEYKVLQNQAEQHFVPCMRMRNNGRIQLYYATGGYRPLSALPAGHSDMPAVARSLLAGVMEVRNNGFLDCRNLAVSPARIFVDTADWQAKLMYFPLSVHQHDSYADFEGQLRDVLQRVLLRPADDLSYLPGYERGQADARIRGMSGPDLQMHRELADDLSGGLSLEEIWKKHGRQDPREMEPKRGLEVKQPKMRLVAMSLAVPFELNVTGERFIIGRMEAQADGAIPFVPTISAPHCRIDWNGDCYTVTDLESLNGTFLNGERVGSQQALPLKNGDVLRLADRDFRVIIG